MSINNKVLRLLLIAALLATSCRGLLSPEDDPAAGAPASPTAGPGSDAVTSPDTATGPNATAAPATAATPDDPASLAATATPALEAAAATPGRPAATVPLDLPALEPLPDLSLDYAPPSSSLDDIVSRANATVPLFQGLRNALDRSQFDLIALNAALDFDPDQISTFVRDEISFEQYPGLLRGPQGTLLGRAGNALDQAALLIALLEDAGYEWRLLRGELDEDQVAALFDQMARPRPPAPPPAADLDALNELLDEIGRLQGFTPEETPELFAALDDLAAVAPRPETIGDDVLLIESALAQAGIELGDPAALDRLRSEAQDYFWVEYRLDAFDDWTAAHPAFADAPPAVDPLETRREIPEELYHRLRFEIFIEQKIGDELFVRPVVTGQEATTAALVGRPFSYQNFPNNFGPETFADIDEMLAGAGIFIPVINGQLAGLGFDLDGRVFDLSLIALDKMGATELFQAVGANVEGAIGALGGIGDDESVPPDPQDAFALTAQWLELTLTLPGGQEETYRRFVFDRIGPDNRENGVAEPLADLPAAAAHRALLNVMTIVPLPAVYPPAYLLDRYAGRVLQEIELLNFLYDNPGFEIPPADLLNSMVPGQDLLLNVAFEAGHQEATDLLSYRPEATVVIHEEGLLGDWPEPTAFERVDVVTNERRVFNLANGRLAPAPGQAIRAGVWETFAERAGLRDAGFRVSTAAEAIRAAQAAGISLRVVPSAADLDRLDLPSQTRRAMRADLDRGFVLIAPEARPEGGYAAWWRVDPASGETLGLTEGGHGGATLVEYIVVWRGLFVAAGFGTCLRATGNFGCCLVAGGALFGIGYFAGALLGAVVSKAVGFIFASSLALGAVAGGVSGDICD